MEVLTLEIDDELMEQLQREATAFPEADDSRE
jgi:hypothetical protein